MEILVGIWIGVELGKIVSQVIKLAFYKESYYIPRQALEVSKFTIYSEEDIK